MIRRVALVVASLVMSFAQAVFGLSMPAAVAVPDLGPAVVVTYYDAPGATITSDATTVRGPPVRYHRHTDYDAHAELPLGASAHPNGLTTPATYGYDDLIRFAHAARGSRGAERRASSAEAGPVDVRRSDVAAKGSSSLDEFWKLSNVGKSRAGTTVPESFDIATAGQKFSVHPNATKHMAEYARSTGAAPPISSLAGSIETAVSRGLTPGRNFVQVGPWELGIDTRGNVSYHALYRP